jgi:hypothetical protein
LKKRIKKTFGREFRAAPSPSRAWRSIPIASVGSARGSPSPTAYVNALSKKFYH